MSQHVLLIDDDSDYHTIVGDSLRLHPELKEIDIVCLSESDAGLNYLLNHKVDLAIIDYLIDSKNGLDLIAAIRNEGLTFPILFLTGYGSEEVATSALKGGASDYIAKGKMNAQTLQRAVRQLLRLGESDRLRQFAEEELATLQQDLEERIASEVAKSRQRDQVMMLQSRLAVAGEVVHNISHQWRQPISSLSIILDEILDAHEHNDLTGEHLTSQIAACKSQINYMSQTVSDFLTFFRSQATDYFSVAQLLYQAERLVATSCNNSSIDLIVKVEHDFTLHGAPNEILQLILIFLNNTIQALNERHSVERYCRLSLDNRTIDNKQYGCLIVEDSAGGIESEHLDQLFELHFTTRTDCGGTGIGLYLARAIVEERFAGRLSAENGEKGARFTVLLPLEKPPCSTES